MGILNKLSNFIFEDTTYQDKVDSLSEITDDTFCSSVDKIWQYNYALSVVSNLLSSYLTNIEWHTYNSDGQRITLEDSYLLNYAPNKKETASEFFGKLAYQLIHHREALIVQLSDKQLFIASSYSFLNSEEQYIKNNTFVNVSIGEDGKVLNRSFKENSSCIYIKLPKNNNIESIFTSMSDEYSNIKELVFKGARRAMGMKLELKLTANVKNKYDEEYLKKMNTLYNRLMEKENAVFITYNGETLNDLTEKQRGSEVQQVLDLAGNCVTINKEILMNVGRAFGISEDIILGTISTDNEDNFTMTMTHFTKPIIKLLSEKFSLFLLEKESILRGARIVGNLDTVKFIDVLAKATSIDKLIGSGAYTINELREKIGDNTVEGGDTRFITKNYSILNDYVQETKGGTNNED